MSMFSVASHFWFPIDNSCRDSSISFNLYRRIKHCYIQAKFEKGDNPKIFDRVMAFFLLRFWLNCQFMVSNQ